MKPNLQVFAALASVILGIAIFAVLLIRFIFGDAVAKSKFSQVSKGMTEAEVRALLGDPHAVRHDALTPTTWCYGGFRRARWCTMEVSFEADRRVISKFHDH